MRVDEQVRERGNRRADLDAFPAQHAAELQLQVEPRGGREHGVRAFEAEELAAAQYFVADRLAVAHLDDWLEVRHHLVIAHQLVELHQRQARSTMSSLTVMPCKLANCRRTRNAMSANCTRSSSTRPT